MTHGDSRQRDTDEGERASPGLPSPDFEALPDGSVLLCLHGACIQTGARRAHRALVSMLIDDGGGDAGSGGAEGTGTDSGRQAVSSHEAVGAGRAERMGNGEGHHALSDSVLGREHPEDARVEMTAPGREGTRSDAERLEAAADLLARFLGAADFPGLRARHPELSGVTPCLVRLSLTPDGVAWEIVGRPARDA